ncbi:hypothetical protein AKJ09_01255 [Labilithrix luteola]|uniref:Uncharacterized protein n=1 Tax=Labilithrix luteola TaxID=1391654 RepID=A0A0K1PMF0_9BACT|nr:hypothetical protein AKJ09_01255 [Labilithrix luteola]
MLFTRRLAGGRGARKARCGKLSRTSPYPTGRRAPGGDLGQRLSARRERSDTAFLAASEIGHNARGRRVVPRGTCVALGSIQTRFGAGHSRGLLVIGGTV